MPINVEQYQRLKKKANEARQEADRARGALDIEFRRLKEDFDCETVEDAERLLKKNESELESLSEAYNAKLEAFEKETGDRL